MLPRINSPIRIVSPRKLIPIIFILSGLVSSCSAASPSTPAVADVFTPTPQVFENTSPPTSANDTAELSSSYSDRLGLCFSYPQGYIQLPSNDAVQIVAPNLPGTDTKGLFWIEISDAYDRTAEVIADQDMTFAAGVDVGRWTLMLGGEQAVVLDGMPGQDFQRRVYVVHEQTLYVLAFMPTRSENKAVNDQMEVLYNAVTSSWTWSPCSVVDVSTSAPPALESTPASTSVNDTVELDSSASERLGLCFSYPQGYTQLPYNDAVQVAAPDLPDTDTKGRFWIEISDAYDRTAEKIADEDMAYAVNQQGVPLENLDRWTATLGGEAAVALDGMPGQDLTRRVYIVHQQTLYILTFSPTRSENKAAGYQMETLYAAVMNSWAWSPCSARE
ncbi:MAG TPA: hypothetical protein VLT51_03850 [Anaerolineales bacterium]|nr:hypothetical protein [Anaerolineales bacterium]